MGVCEGGVARTRLVAHAVNAVPGGRGCQRAAAATPATSRPREPSPRSAEGDYDTPSYNIFAEIRMLPKYLAFKRIIVCISADILNVYSDNKR